MQNPMAVARQKENAKIFTLIEMLVVIAIIGILASLIMPSLDSALQTSRSIACTNNMRQCGITFSVYSDSNDGNILLYSSVSGLAHWSTALITDGLGENRNIFLCNDAAPSEFVDTGMTYGIRIGTWGNYNYAPDVASEAAFRNVTVASGEYRFFRPSQYKSPSKAHIIADSVFTSDSPYNPLYKKGTQKYSLGNNMQLRHVDMTNILWADNHVGSFSVADIWDTFDNVVIAKKVYSRDMEEFSW